MVKETKSEIAQRMSFEEIYREISDLKIKETELDIIITRVNNEDSQVRSAIMRWNDIAGMKRRSLTTPPQH